MRILIAGSSGFLGRALVGSLRRAGHDVLRLVRHLPTADDQRSWRPDRDELDPAALAGVETVINLAGAPLGLRVGPVQLPARAWTAGYQQEFRASRVDSTALLARTIATADPRPATFLAGGAVGIYGDTGDTAVDERSAPGTGYFAETAQAWEAATEPAQAAGVRVVAMRTGFPLHRSGGMLGPLLLPFRLGLGGRVGDGRQWQPWMSIADWLAAVEFLLRHPQIEGPVNLVGPQPVTNAEFTRVLAELLHRPAVLPLPAPVLRTVLGEFGREALTSKRVLPRVLPEAGFRFAEPDLPSALRSALQPLPE